MKAYFLLVVASISFGMAMAQFRHSANRDSVMKQQAPAQYKSEVEYYGVAYPCNMAEYVAPTDVVEDAIKQYMLSLGYKAESKKGFLVYRNVRVPNVRNGEPVDMFYSVSTKSRQEKDKSIVYAITAETGRILDKKPEKGTVVPGNVVIASGCGTHLAMMSQLVAQKEHLRQVMLQQEVIEKANKKLKDLQEDYANMSKKVEQLQKDMAQNKKDQEDAAKKLAEENKKLTELEAQKPTSNN